MAKRAGDVEDLTTWPTPRPWSQDELDELRSGASRDEHGALVELLDRLDVEVQEARRTWQASVMDNRAWLAGYLEALEHTYTAVERHAQALGLLSSGWR